MLKTIYEEKLILEDGDNQIILDKAGMEALYQELRTLLGKDDY